MIPFLLRFPSSLLLATMLLSGGIAIAAEQSQRPEHPGKVLYRQYCASCHGLSGKGDGPLTPALVQKPTDLTILAKKAGGSFPFWETMRIIDGTRTVRAHGDSDMPVWGQVFRDESEWGLARRAEIQGKLTFLTEYLLSIQQD